MSQACGKVIVRSLRRVGEDRMRAAVVVVLVCARWRQFVDRASSAHLASTGIRVGASEGGGEARAPR